MIGELIKIKPVQLPAVRKKRKPPLWKRAWVRKSLVVLLLLGLALYITARLWLHQFEVRANAFDLTKMKEFEVTTIIHDRFGNEIGQLAEENRRPVKFEEIPFHFIQCLIATEDGRFYEHQGVDYIGILRAVVAYAKTRRISQGASTITQQLARQTYAKADPSMLKRSYDRKLTEMFLAKRIEENFTKNEILEMYLNRIYFGSGYHGVNAAALGYFGHPASQLTMEESALLCGLIKNPGLYSPLKDPEKSLSERNQTFDRMVVEKILTKHEAEKYKAMPIKLDPTRNNKGGNYVMAEVEAEVTAILEQYGYDEVAGRGLHIYTTLDVALQKAAEESVQRRLLEAEKRPRYTDYLKEVNSTREFRKDRPRTTYEDYVAQLDAYNRGRANGSVPAEAPPPYPGYLQGAAIVLDNKTGDTLAMVGGRNFSHIAFNCATRALRAPGTAFYPFVYAAAFEDQAFPGTMLSDEPFDNNRIMVGGTQGILGEWGREGLGDKHKTKITARGALSQSMNGPAARLGLQLGLPKVRAMAERAGLEPTKDLPASILGSSDVSLRSLALAYTSFPNGGKRATSPQLVTKITDRDGGSIYERPPNSSSQITVTDPISAHMITSCLQDALSVGTGAASAEYGLQRIPAAGKTGTHLDSKDLWFAGYTSEVTCAVWLGMWDRDETILPNAFSHQFALPAWVDIINASTEKYRPQEFAEPSDIETVELCSYTGARASDQCYESRQDPTTKVTRAVRTTYQEYIRHGFKVFGTCELHAKGTGIGADTEAPLHINPGSDQTGEAVAVTLMAPTVIGTDPYESIRPIMRAQSPDDPTEGTPKTKGPELIDSPDPKNTSIDLPVPQPVEIE